MSANDIMNSPWLWMACGLGVCWVAFQSILFLKKSLKITEEVGITKEQVKATVKTSLVATIGPSLGVLVGMVALLVSMGGPISWFRLSYIGSVGYETYAAELGAQAAGESLGTALTANGFVTAVWVMTLGAMGGILISALFTDKIDKLQNVLAGGRKEMLPIISSCAVCGVFSYLTMDRVFRFNSQTVAAVSGFVIMAAFCAYNKTAKKKWIRDWGFTISMFVGMLISVLI